MTPGKERNFRDVVEPFTIDDVDFDDPLERAAIAYHRATFETAAEVGSRFAPSQRGELAYTWARLEPQQRRRYRLLADLVLRAHTGDAGA